MTIHATELVHVNTEHFCSPEVSGYGAKADTRLAMSLNSTVGWRCKIADLMRG